MRHARRILNAIRRTFDIFYLFRLPLMPAYHIELGILPISVMFFVMPRLPFSGWSFGRFVDHTRR